MDTPKPKSLDTLCAHAGAPEPEERKVGEPFVPPIVQSTIFNLGTAQEAADIFAGKLSSYAYTRFGNPTVDHLAKALAKLEGGAEALVTASGNAATLTAVMMSLRGKNDRVVATPDLYGGTLEVLRILAERTGLHIDTLDPRDEEPWYAAIRQATLVFVESPSNPLLRLVDLQAVSKAARQAGAVLIVDNTVATPFNQNPLALGADLVVHSTSKYLNGHSDAIGGAIVAREKLTPAQLSVYKNLGATVNAIDAWLTLRGLRTFALRMAAHNRNGQAVAEWLARHHAVSAVHYPGLDGHPQKALFARQMRAAGALLSFELKGGAPAAEAFLNRIRLVVHAVSLGGLESLATRPATTSHRSLTPEQRKQAGVTDSLIRLSVGTEALTDLLDDIEQALA